LATKYAVISDGEINVSSGNLVDELSFNAPDINAELPAVFLCVVQPNISIDLRIRLRVTLNNRSVLTLRFDDEIERSLHAVIGQDVIQASNNTLTIEFKGDTGNIRVKDIVLLYQ